MPGRVSLDCRTTGRSLGGFETLNGAREYAREEDLKAWDIFHGNLPIERHEPELHCVVWPPLGTLNGSDT
jgi:hypothetical protein